jgi:hypothetical protein
VGRKIWSDKEDTMNIAEILLLVACLLYVFGDQLRLPHEA